jgi:anthranilate phosphoribosyltransferase
VSAAASSANAGAPPEGAATFDSIGGWPGVLGPLTDRRDLPREHTRLAMAEVLRGDATPAQLAGFVVALRLKGETVEELSGLLEAMLGMAERVVLPAELAERAVDIVGTGGDRSHSINVSTLAMLVAAGAGLTICKHGNRAASSSCGAADVLGELGVAVELGPAGVVRCVREAGFGFCFAPRFHPALRHAGPTRRELGIPTAFNVLGPMANPGRVARQVIGVADARMAERMLGVLRDHGARHVLVVHGGDGLDELTTTGASSVWELRDGDVRTYEIDPAAYGIARADAAELRGGPPAHNAALARAVLDGERGPRRDIVVLNAAAGLYVGGLVESIADGLPVAEASIDDGRAAAALERLVAVSQAAAADGAAAG